MGEDRTPEFRLELQATRPRTMAGHQTLYLARRGGGGSV